MSGQRKIRVAAIQCISKNGDPAGNLARAERLVAKAAAAGAQLVLAPEFLATGYIFDQSIWDAAEPGENGVTGIWLKKMAKMHGIFIGASFLDAEGDHFYNTFLLAAPDGTTAGKVRKQRPACYEAFFTRGETGPHVIETALGRIAVGVCYENQWAFFPELVRRHRASLVLQPHSAPTPSRSVFYSEKERQAYNRVLRNLSESYARILGVPVVMCNKCGPWQSPLPGLPLREDSAFPGLSCIVDGNGKVLQRLGDEEGVVVADVTMGDNDRAGAEIDSPCHCGQYAVQDHWPTRLWQTMEFLGRIYYALSIARRKKARLIAASINAG